jgi:hypothetical protein
VAIQTAIDYVLGLPYKGILFLPAGKYKISKQNGKNGLILDTDTGDNGSGITIIGAGVSSTWLVIDDTSNAITGIDIPQSSPNVVIKNLRITIADSPGNHDQHTGIDATGGLAAYFENVMIVGDSSAVRMKCGIKAIGSGCNLYHFCTIGNVTTGIWLTSGTIPGPGGGVYGANATKIIDCTFNNGWEYNESRDICSVRVDAGNASEITGCTFHGAHSNNPDYKGIDIYLGGTSMQTVVMNNYHEFGDIGIRIHSLGNTVIGNWYGDSYQPYIDMPFEPVNYQGGNIIMGSRKNAGTTDPTFFGGSTWGALGDEAVVKLGDDNHLIKAVHTHGLVFQTFNDDTSEQYNAFRWKNHSGAEVMRLYAQTGNLWLQRTNTKQRLEVEGNALIKGDAGWITDGDVTSLYLGDTEHSIRAVRGVGVRIGTFHNSSLIALKQSGLYNEGAVGIGQTDPSEKLDVNGNIKVGSSDSYLIGSVKICSGSGSPYGVVSAPLGSLYLNTSGGAGTTLYVKESGGTGNTGWVGK